MVEGQEPGSNLDAKLPKTYNQCFENINRFIDETTFRKANLLQGNSPLVIEITDEGNNFILDLKDSDRPHFLGIEGLPHL